jgi:voltage-gated potassium channel
MEVAQRMFLTLLYAFGLMSATVIIHGFGTLEAISRLSRLWRQNKGSQRGSFVSAIHVLRGVSFLLFLHLLEAGVWAGFYFASGTLPDFETAAYFSLTSYTTLGYGDVLLPAPWRILGPFEGAVGILTFGWSTGILVTTLSTIYGSRLRPVGE